MTNFLLFFFSLLSVNITLGFHSTVFKTCQNKRLSHLSPTFSDQSKDVILFGKRSLADELNSIENEGKSDGDESKAEKPKPSKKEKIKLAPEVVAYEGGPDPSELVVPTISILTVIGLIPFAAAVARQLWVKYTITSRRVRVVSGFNGKDETEVVYPDIKKMVYAYRFFGRCGDVVLELRDGSKLELRSMPDFQQNYQFIFDKTSSECQEASDKIKVKDIID
mmetsp:Transcript_20726/g.30673  ORF Transcript_20726/g.30673 Transcript_20726/m.30673 type:complete len:222 (-) Transcript_20726:40-705(-)